LDFRAWSIVLGKLGKLFPALEWVNVDDFTVNLDTFTAPLIHIMRSNINAGGVKFTPTFYFSLDGTSGRDNFILTVHSHLATATDGILFYFRNQLNGQAECRASANCTAPADCHLPCLSGNCALASVKNYHEELAMFEQAIPAATELIGGIYFSSYSGCGEAPALLYDVQLLYHALNAPRLAGAVAYRLESLKEVTQCPTPDSTRFCIVKNLFG
jgi:hypothetical protein